MLTVPTTGLYIITYDITSDSRRNDIRDYIVETYDIDVKLESSYVVKTHDKAKDIMAQLKSKLERGDKVFVANVSFIDRAEFP